MRTSTDLIWSPIHEYLEGQIKNNKSIRLLISPFITQGALKSLVEACKDVSQLKIITRWTGADILSGVADLDIYNYLHSKRIPLYLHNSIHLKLFVFDSASAFHTSGNITHKGLGLSHDSNIEIGCLVSLSVHDWKQIFNILNQSFSVDDATYERARAYLLKNKKDIIGVPPLNLNPVQDKDFSTLSLPASASPDYLYRFYELRQEDHATSDELTPAYIHDMLLYDMPEGLGRDEFFVILNANFKRHPFISSIVSMIKEFRTARFGQVNAWLQRECSDRPTPYRWELKTNTRILYTWLEYFYSQITWDRPNYSMIIRWNGD